MVNDHQKGRLRTEKQNKDSGNDKCLNGENIHEKNMSDILEEEYFYEKRLQAIEGGEILITERKYSGEKNT